MRHVKGKNIAGMNIKNFGGGVQFQIRLLSLRMWSLSKDLKSKDLEQAKTNLGWAGWEGNVAREDENKGSSQISKSRYSSCVLLSPVILSASCICQLPV